MKWMMALLTTSCSFVITPDSVLSLIDEELILRDWRTIVTVGHHAYRANISDLRDSRFKL